MQSNSAAFRLKLGTTNTHAEVCSAAFKRNPALAGRYWRHNRAAIFKSECRVPLGGSHEELRSHL